MRPWITRFQAFLIMNLLEGLNPYVTGPYGEDWTSLWRVMNLADEHQMNLRSSCPWQYVRDVDNTEFRPQLFHVANISCIDLDRSTTYHVVYIRNGVCTPVRAFCSGSSVQGNIVGFTCMKVVESDVDNRNEKLSTSSTTPPDDGAASVAVTSPHVTEHTTRAHTTSTSTTSRAMTSSSATMASQKSPNDSGYVKDEKTTDSKQYFTDKPSTILSQNFIAPFTMPGGAQYNTPPFFNSDPFQNGAPPPPPQQQFQPGFLNPVMYPLAGVPPLMLQFGTEVTDGNQGNEGTPFYSKSDRKIEEKVLDTLKELKDGYEARSEQQVQLIIDSDTKETAVGGKVNDLQEGYKVN